MTGQEGNDRTAQRLHGPAFAKPSVCKAQRLQSPAFAKPSVQVSKLPHPPSRTFLLCGWWGLSWTQVVQKSDARVWSMMNLPPETTLPVRKACRERFNVERKISGTELLRAPT